METICAKPLNFYCNPDSAVLWWEKPAQAMANQRWQITLDHQVHGVTDRTHYTLSGLCPQSVHTTAVQALNADGQPIGSPCAVQLSLPAEKRKLDVTQPPYGAVGDGKTMNTAALQRAIDDCDAGACVWFPAGIYRSGALRLHSDMELYLAEGAVLQGSALPQDYLPRIRSRFEGTEMDCYQSLLNLGELDHTAGPNCQNVILRGKGTIRGGGLALAKATLESERAALKDFLSANTALVASCENENTIPGRVRGRLIHMSNCSNVRISGLTLADGASWNVHFIYSDHILTDHCVFHSQNIWNGDGWDPDSSTDSTIFACTFYTGDDSVAIKSGKNPEGNVINRPTARIQIFDCRCAFGHGLCIGSEMSGGVEDVHIWDCDLRNSMLGIEVKGTPKRGGFVRRVSVQDCTVPCLLVHSVNYNDDGIPAATVPVFENFQYSRVEVTGKSLQDDGWHACRALELHGFAAPGHELCGVTLNQIRITGGLGTDFSRCKGLSVVDCPAIEPDDTSAATTVPNG